jgi:hypothetical protein
MAPLFCSGDFGELKDGEHHLLHIQGGRGRRGVQRYARAHTHAAASLLRSAWGYVVTVEALLGTPFFPHVATSKKGFNSDSDYSMYFLGVL